MDNYEYMAMGRKLCKTNDRNNLATGLFVTTLVLGGCIYIQYRRIKRQNQNIKSFLQSIDNLTRQNLNQKREIASLKKENKEQRQMDQTIAIQIEDINNRQP
jgi:hypothetical protein